MGTGLRGARALQEATLGRDASSTAVVTLHSVARATEAQQVVLSHEDAWVVRKAPEPRDILWGNITTPRSQIKLRHRIGQAAIVFGLLFWSVPVAFIQTWASLGNLQVYFPSIDRLQEWSPSLFAFLISYLPVMALIGLQFLLPTFFYWIAVRYEGHKVKSEVDRMVFNRVFGYQLASLYVTVISGSLWDALEQIIKHPGYLLVFLSRSLPKVAVYFLTYVLARVGSGLPLLLLRPWALASWPRSRNDLGPSVGHCWFGCEAPTAALVLVIGLTYSFIAPAILPACTLYFGVGSLVYRWLFTYVYEPEFDGRGALWYDLFNSVVLGLLLGTLSLLALALVFADRLQCVALLPLPLGVSIFAVWCWRHPAAASQWVALPDAVTADREGLQFELHPELYSDFEASPRRRPVAAGFCSVSSPRTIVGVED